MDYKEVDFEGEETLKAIANANKFNAWMYQTIQGYCEGDILEIGSGIGNISKYFIADKKSITLSDIRAQYRDFLMEAEETKSAPTIEMDIVDPDFSTKYAQYHQKFNAVFALNVVEHVKEDQTAIKNLLSLLKPGGKLIILVPAYAALFNSFDVELMHYKRYTRSNLKAIMLQKNSELIKSFYFNFAGIFGWFIVGGLLKKKIIPSENMRLYNTLVPIFKLVDRCIFNLAGLSVVCVVRKK